MTCASMMRDVKKNAETVVTKCLKMIMDDSTKRGYWYIVMFRSVWK